MKMNFLTLGAAAVALCAFMPNAQAETVKTQTIIQGKQTPGVKSVDFSAFDINKDGILTMEEVGENLFYMFDTDGNEVIDNIEWDNVNVYTITPMEKQTFTYVDFNDDGVAEHATYTYEQFWKESQLVRFDEDADGLSPSEFINVGFQKLDINDNNTIELKEWKKGYIETVIPESAEQERYNN